jgi:hypothetical protein
MKSRFVVQSSLVTGRDTRLAIAVFDDWMTLHAVLDDILRTCALHPGMVVLSKDPPPPTEELGRPREMVTICFPHPRRYATCLQGTFAGELSSSRSPTLANALSGWVPLDQTGPLESHVERGHVVLLIELRDTEELGTICERLVRHSPHIVRLSRGSGHPER